MLDIKGAHWFFKLKLNIELIHKLPKKKEKISDIVYRLFNEHDVFDINSTTIFLRNLQISGTNVHLL